MIKIITILFSLIFSSSTFANVASTPFDRKRNERYRDVRDREVRVEVARCTDYTMGQVAQLAQSGVRLAIPEILEIYQSCLDGIKRCGQRNDGCREERREQPRRGDDCGENRSGDNDCREDRREERPEEPRYEDDGQDGDEEEPDYGDGK